MFLTSNATSYLSHLMKALDNLDELYGEEAKEFLVEVKLIHESNAEVRIVYDDLLQTYILELE